jgi:acyl-CoA thioester hydrolase
MGVVYHAHFLDYFEAARTEAFRALGLSYRELEARGVMMPVVEANVRYRRPARYDDRLVVETRLPAEAPSVRLPTRYVVRRADEDPVLVEGDVTLCFMDAECRRPIRAPEEVKRLFARSD